MGNSKDATGKPQFTASPTQTVADLQAAVDYAEDVGGLLSGTSAERLNMTAGQVQNGWLFVETDTARIFVRQNNEWVRFAAIARGVYSGPTSATGTVGFDHGLGATPGSVIVTDRNGGAAIATRKTVFVTANSLQIQVAVYNTVLVQTSGGYELQSSLLANNPVEFNWMAIL